MPTSQAVVQWGAGAEREFQRSHTERSSWATATMSGSAVVTVDGSAREYSTLATQERVLGSSEPDGVRQ